MNGLIPEQLYFTPIFKSLITQSGETSLTLTSLGPEKEERRFCIVPLSSIRFFYFVSISACCATTHAIPGSGGPHRTSLLQGIGTRRVCAVKSQFTLCQSDGSRPRARGLANNFPQLDNRDILLCRILSSRPPFWPLRLLAYQKSEMFYKQPKMLISSVLIS